MLDTALSRFIAVSKQKGAGDEFLAALLTRRGWAQEEVFDTLADYWEGETGVPVPRRGRAGESSRDAFLYLLAFSTLATWATALGAILLAFIDHAFPDLVTGLHMYEPRLEVTWKMASLAVAFPIFLVAMRSILGEAKRNPERLESGVRRWLTYIALLLTACGVICDLIWFLDYFLQGDLTIRFVLKAGTVLAICGSIFVYYLGSLRWDRNTNMATAAGWTLRFGAGAAIAVVTCFCIGLALAGTPTRQRVIEADNRRVQDLHSLAQSLYFAWQQHPGGLLPASLSEAPGSEPMDPSTHTAYTYKPLSGSTYELCAQFGAPSSQYDGVQAEFWHHDRGETCFTLEASRTPPWP